MTDPITQGELIFLTVLCTLFGAGLVAGLSIAAVLTILSSKKDRE